MDHIFRRQPSTGREHGFTRRQLPNLRGDFGALFQDRRTTRVMNGTVHPTSAQKVRVRGVHDGFGGFFRDVGWSVKVEDLSPGKRYPKSKVRHAIVLRYFLLVRASTPGKVLPSRNS